MEERKMGKIIILNNKCNFTKDEYVKYIRELKSIINKYSNTIIVCPSTCYLSLVEDNSIILGSQNVDENDFGNYTGKVSIKQLKSLNVKYTIVGHQETRKYNNETNMLINKKIVKLLDEGITPILCVGELEKISVEETIKYIKNQLKECLKDINDKEKIIIAYEPFWAIGNSITEDICRIEKVLEEIRKIYSNNILIYGGGLNIDDIDLFKTFPHLSGYLLGNMSLDINKVDLALRELS